MNLIAVAQIIFFTTYWTIRFGKDGIPKSLSDDYYRLQAQGKAHYFDRFFYAFAIPMLAYGYYDYHAYTLMLLAIAGLFLILVPIAPFFRITKVSTWHYIGATGAIAFGFWGVTFEYWVNWIAFIPLVGFIVTVGVLKWQKVKNYTTWVEIAAVFWIFSRLIIL